jgi:2Fe-2S ferredoxin
MPTVHLITHDGQSHTLDVAAGTPLMQAATAAGVPGIVGECGGSAMCATCHVYVDEAWFDQLPPPSDDEEDLLFSTLDKKPTSRLSCQILLSDELDGLRVTLAESACKQP